MIMLDDGHVLCSGPFGKLMKENERFKSMMEDSGVNTKKKGEKSAKATEQTVKETKEQTAQYQEEGKEVGNVPPKIYWYWAKHGGVVLVILAGIIMATMVGLNVASTWWLQYWPKDYYERVCTVDQREQYFCALLLFAMFLTGFTSLIFLP